MTRSKKVSEETFTTTLAILKNVSAPAEEAKENSAAPEPPRYHILPRGEQSLPCAQYKTDKGYRCPNCQRCYNARKNLVRHVTLECGREPQYKCPHCAYSKHRRNELKKHMEKKHPDLAQPAPSPSPAPAPALVK